MPKARLDACCAGVQQDKKKKKKIVAEIDALTSLLRSQQKATGQADAPSSDPSLTDGCALQHLLRSLPCQKPTPFAMLESAQHESQLRMQGRDAGCDAAAP